MRMKAKRNVALFTYLCTTQFLNVYANGQTRTWQKNVTFEKDSISTEELFAYIGLEMAKSISKLNDLKEYWFHILSMEMTISNASCQEIGF